MTNWFNRSSEASDGLEQDMILAEALSALDPETYDPNYWFRFRGWVVSSAAGALARRRIPVELTIGDVLTSWARMVVPTAAVAAAVAAVVLVRPDVPLRQNVAAEPLPIAVEEQLVSELPSDVVPMLLAPDAAAGLVAFASDIF